MHVTENPLGGWHVHGVPGTFDSREDALSKARELAEGKRPILVHAAGSTS